MEYHEKLKFLYLLERPSEPLYMGPKGHGTTKYLYNLPPEYLEPYQAQAMVEFRKLIPPSVTLVECPVYKPRVPYDLSKIQAAVPKKAAFSEFNPLHMKASLELSDILLSQTTKDDFFNASALCRDSVNTHLWINAFARASQTRADMHGFLLPAIWEVMPDMFIEHKVWREAIGQATFPDRERAVVVVDKNFTGTDLNPEHKLAYFTEDPGANSHHWHWHVVIPFGGPKGSVERRGEIFYYMHHGMLARYETERLANGLNRTVPLNMHKGLLEEACFPKLTLQNSGMNFAGRQENSVLKDFDRKEERQKHTVQDIISWFERVIEAIDAGFAIQEGGGRINLRTDQGIDVVTAMWESSNDSPHLKYYGVPHNLGHSAIGFVHDPDSRYKEAPGCMYFPATSMRDPVFFRWHRFLDFISQRQKDYLEPYSHEHLQWNGIVANDIQVVRVEPSLVPMPTLNPLNNLVTHWMQSDVEMSRGLDFGRTNVNGLGSIWVRVTHLQHVPFLFRIRATNQTRDTVKATVRIFMAPKLDENGDKMPFYEQRILFFELDKFVVNLHPGDNLINRKSEDSNLTIPWGQTFRELERDIALLNPSNDPTAYCGCGWPAHLLLPRGKVDGMPFDLTVMLTPTQVDQVASSRRQLGTPSPIGTCQDSVSYCPLKNDKNPDSRPMGYPFDRPAVPEERTKTDMFLADYVQPISNMTSQEVKIFYVNKTVLRGDGAPRDLREIHVQP